MKVNIDDIHWMEELYPRSKLNENAISRYRLNIENLPPIDINQEKILIDGYHRLMAYRSEGKTEIEANIRDVAKENILIEAIKANAKHGTQLKAEEKSALARKLFDQGIEDENFLQELLAASSRKIADWLQDKKIAKKDEQKIKAWDLWLACYTQDEIAESINVTQKTINQWILAKIADLQKSIKKPDSLQIFNKWDFAACDSRYGAKYHGRMPGQVIENLLWYYTDIGDVVFDPMAGSGTTGDVCKLFGRRYLQYDLHKAEAKQIYQHDILTGLPRKKGFVPKLLILDPPYSQQKEGEYSKHPSNLANKPPNEFNSIIAKLIDSALKDIEYVAFIVSPTRKEKKHFDHVLEIYSQMKKKECLIERIIVTYTTQQATGAERKHAEDNKYMLRQCRDLMIFKNE